MEDSAVKLVALAKKKLGTAIDYSSRAVCPICGKANLKVITSRPWEDNSKIRYHRCENPDCILSGLGMSIKSVETDL